MILNSRLIANPRNFRLAQGEECRVFHDPSFVVQGKGLKQWVGRLQETGIQVCGRKRPKK